MRWYYYNENAAESAEREAAIIRIDEWWHQFEKHVEKFLSFMRQEAYWDLPRWMSDNLDRIHPGIKWEFGPSVRGEGCRLVLTPESRRELRPLVAKVLERAPSLPGWEFYDARLPEDLESTLATVEARASYDIGDFLAQASISDLGLIDLCYYSPQIQGDDDERAFEAAFVATETLLGERCLDRWVGRIEVRPFAKKRGRKAHDGSEVPRHAISLDRLKDTVDAAVESVRDQLPRSPHYEWVEDASWTMWKLEVKGGEEAEDFPGQADLFVGKSPNAAMWKAAHSGRTFCSERYTGCGETFCYLKIDRDDGPSDSPFGDKGEIEDALDEALIPRELGCQIGGGMGLRYAYIDLALTDVPAAIAAIRECLQAGGVSKRSWILFFDSDLGNEWVGIYDDSPNPPS